MSNWPQTEDNEYFSACALLCKQTLPHSASSEGGCLGLTAILGDLPLIDLASAEHLALFILSLHLLQHVLQASKSCRHDSFVVSNGWQSTPAINRYATPHHTTQEKGDLAMPSRSLSIAAGENSAASTPPSL